MVDKSGSDEHDQHGAVIAYAAADSGYSYPISPATRVEEGTTGTWFAIPALQASVRTDRGRLDITVTFGTPPGGGGEPVHCALPTGPAFEGYFVVVDNDPTITLHTTGANPNVLSPPGTVEFVTGMLTDGVHLVQVFSTDPGAFLTGPGTCLVTGLLKVQAVQGASLVSQP
jgi:hypothetical protein